MKHLILLISIFGLLACNSQSHKTVLTKFQVNKIDSLLKVNKFDDKAFDNRGLIPSDRQLGIKMNRLVNECLKDILKSSNYGIKPINTTKILDKGLRQFKRNEFDTEEKEFIADEFIEISNILNVDYNENIEKWVYGKLFYSINNHSLNKESEIKDTIFKCCINCQDTIKLGVTSYKEGIPENWTIIKCKKCSTSNAIKLAKNIEGISFINCIAEDGFMPEYDSISADSVVKINNMK
jgi:hypothetical protein